VVVELAARFDPELRVHLAQVPLDGARADEQPGADLRVRKPVPGETRHLPLLPVSSSRVTDGALAHFVAGDEQFDPGALDERFHAHIHEHRVGGS